MSEKEKKNTFIFSDISENLFIQINPIKFIQIYFNQITELGEWTKRYIYNTECLRQAEADCPKLNPEELPCPC